MRSQDAAEQPWAIVLAGGDGTRLQALTREIDGDARPKQFSRVLGDQTLLGHTRNRLRPMFGDDRVRFVVTRQHESFYAEELADVDRSHVLSLSYTIATFSVTTRPGSLTRSETLDRLISRSQSGCMLLRSSV